MSNECKHCKGYVPWKPFQFFLCLAIILAVGISTWYESLQNKKFRLEEREIHKEQEIFKQEFFKANPDLINPNLSLAITNRRINHDND